MRITEVRLGRISVPLRVPFKTALRRVDSVEDVIVEVRTDVGAVGYGEAPPTGVITGDTTGSILGAIRDHIAKAILGREVDDFEDLMQAVQRSVVKNTSAKAAVDMALWDLYGQLYDIPVHKLMGGARRQIITDITISVNPPEEMARDALDAARRGYDCLKVKVGADPTLDVARLAAVRQAVGQQVCIRIDANQAWQPKEAVRILNQMQERGLQIEFVEQPVAAHDFDGLKYVTERSYVPVLADESVFSPEDALRIMQMRAADLVNIKLMKCGGLYNALKIASAAEVYGVECMIGCMLEAKIAVNAAVELACAKKIITKVDLDGPVLCSVDPIQGGAVFQEKEITVSDAPGLGIQGIDPAYLTWLEEKEKAAGTAEKRRLTARGAPLAVFLYRERGKSPGGRRDGSERHPAERGSGLRRLRWKRSGQAAEGLCHGISDSFPGRSRPQKKRSRRRRGQRRPHWGGNTAPPWPARGGRPVAARPAPPPPQKGRKAKARRCG